MLYIYIYKKYYKCINVILIILDEKKIPKILCVHFQMKAKGAARYHHMCAPEVVVEVDGEGLVLPGDGHCRTEIL